MRKTIALALAAVTAIAVAPIVAGPANATTVNNAVVITGAKLSNFRLHTNSCRYIPVTVSTNARSGLVSSMSISIDVTRNGKAVDTILDYVYGARNFGTIRTEWFYCPNLYGVGTFKLGEAQLQWSDADYNSYTSLSKLHSSAVIKQDAKLSISHKRSRGRTVVSGVGKYYAGYDGWTKFSRPLGVRLQSSKNGKTWKNVKSTHTIGKTGKYRFVVKTKKHYKYRVVEKGTATTWNASSPTFRG